MFKRIEDTSWLAETIHFQQQQWATAHACVYFLTFDSLHVCADQA